MAAGGAVSGAWQLTMGGLSETARWEYADMAISVLDSGSITAACFLATLQKLWAHIDVAGTAFQSMQKGAQATSSSPSRALKT